MRERRILVIVAGLAVGLAAAAWWVGHGHGAPGQWTPVARPPRIRPDYRGAVIPPNIAPLNFVVEEPGTACYVRVAGAAEESLAVRSRDGGVQLPPGPWKALLAQNRGKPLSVETYVRDHDRGWQRFEPIRWDVAEDEIDPYLAYRVLDAVYDYYKYVGIYQRHLESHDETSLLFNSEFNRGCVNCHSFLNNRPETCLVHSRPGADESIAAGPILVRDGKAARVKTRTKAIPRVAFVTSWHPSGNLAAFCVNWFGQFMRATGAEPREVVDLDSDVQIVDFRTGGISTAPGIADPDRLETFPSWSPDGKYLFFSSAPRLWEKTAFAPLKDFKQAKYDLMRIPYDPDADTWGEPELLLSAAETGKSILQPRPSPDGRYLLFCMCDHGPFPAFQEDSDLCLMDLADRSYRPLEKANSPRSESWHSWSSNSRWIVFSWGPVSLTGREIGWSRGAQTPSEEYDNLYQKFNPTRFDADQWVAVAKAAGMKYIVLTTKHHDGFCLWDTRQTDFNIMHAPFGRDVTKELAEACRRGGIAFGTYHSVCDWHHPDFPLTSPGGRAKREASDIAAYRRYLRAQVTELITKYGPLLTVWFDVPQQFDRAEGSENVRLCRTLQPDILVNNRAGGGCGDYATPEQRVGGFDIERPWETCMTICRQWAWKPDDKMKTLPECLQTLIRTAGGDGNLLFNVGPMPTGEIEPRQVERLKEMGAWLSKSGASIYGTRGGPFKPARHLVSTRKDNTIYLHILAWPDEVLSLPALPARIVRGSVLTGGAARFEQTDAGIEISVPRSDRREIDTVVALQLDRPAMDIAPIAVASVGQSLAEGAKATASNVYQQSDHYAAAMAVDGDGGTRWATDAGTGPCWLEVDLGRAETFDRALIDECVDWGVRVKAFELECKVGDEWKAFYTGKRIGKQLEVRFEPVTARFVRLNITEGQGGPTISEFQLFAPAARR